MSKYVPKIEREIKFEDDMVRVVLDPLTRAVHQEIAPRIAEARGELSDEDIKSGKFTLRNEAKAKLDEAAIAVLHKHLLEITGLRDANGNPVTKETVLSKVYFNTLVTEIFSILYEVSHLGKATSSD